MALRFYNTLTQEVQPFVPVDPNGVRMYTCGPTVYDFAHIGNFRTFVFYDLLRRWLRASGFQTRSRHEYHRCGRQDHPQCRRAEKSLDDYTAIYTKPFSTIAPRCAWNSPSGWCALLSTSRKWPTRSTSWKEGGYTYRSDGSVYFRICEISRTTASSRTTISAAWLRERASMSITTIKPTHAISHCGKRRNPANPAWDTEIGPGRPGWHIECSVMAIEYPGGDARSARRRHRSDFSASRK